MPGRGLPWGAASHAVSTERDEAAALQVPPGKAEKGGEFEASRGQFSTEDWQKAAQTIQVPCQFSRHQYPDRIPTRPGRSPSQGQRKSRTSPPTGLGGQCPIQERLQGPFAAGQLRLRSSDHTGNCRERRATPTLTTNGATLKIQRNSGLV